MLAQRRSNTSRTCGTRKSKLLFPLLLPAIHSTAQEFPMPSYDSFMCPNCEHYFRVIWPVPMPSYHDPCSKIKMKCPDCGEVTELYNYLITKILQAPEPGTPHVIAGDAHSADTRRGDPRESMLFRLSRRSRWFRSNSYDCGGPKEATVPTRVAQRSPALWSAGASREAPCDS